jgi:2-keto-4-pentenoate hydratase/2-oxohepta-3-ene-1,7-dioic acid hydratase in catechol pathway
MKLITYAKDSSISCGILTNAGIIDIPSSKSLLNPPSSVIQILQQGRACLEKLQKLTKTTSHLLSIDSVRLLAPIPNPPKVIALAGNYSEHIKEASLKRGFKLGLSDSARNNTVPRPFLMPSTVIIGPDEKIPWPIFSQDIDYEIELAVVIGRRCNRRLHHRKRRLCTLRNLQKAKALPPLGRILRLAQRKMG